MNLKERTKSLKKTVPAVFLALKDRDTPIIAKILAGITVGYALSPIVLIWLLILYKIVGLFI